MTKYALSPASELPEGTRRVFVVKGRPIVVFNIAGEYFAMLNKCPHQGAPLADGKLTALMTSPSAGMVRCERAGEILRCPWHGWEFDVRSGESWFDPAHTKVRMYEVDLETGSELRKGPYKAELFDVSVEEEYLVVEL